MGITINTNFAALSIQRHLALATDRLKDNYVRLATGLRLAKDDPSGLAIGERMRTEMRALSQAVRNVQDGIDLLSTGEAALAEVTNVLSRMRELAIEAASGTIGMRERQVLDLEFQELARELDRLSEAAEFNDQPIFASTHTLRLQVGPDAGDVLDIALPHIGEEALGVNGLSVTSAARATRAIEGVDQALDAVAGVRATLGTYQTVLEGRARVLGAMRDGLASATSRIRDVDLAAETADLARNGILQHAALAVLAQAQVGPQVALDLLLPG